MSTATTPTPAVPQTTTGNMFQYVNHSGHTKVNYDLQSNVPPMQGRPTGAPTLSYDGPEGTFNFTGDGIAQEETKMGTVVTVVLRPQRDGGSTMFSLFVPPVVISGTGAQKFTTYAVKTYRPGTVQSPGAQITYEVERLEGSAEYIRFHVG